jgi:DnaD/phage-associated family protein
MILTSTGFVGFPDVKMRPVKIPDLFFTDLLAQIDDLGELKLALHCFWLLNEQSGDYRYLRGADLRSDTRLLASLSLANDLRSPQAAVEDALQRCVARNTLLRMEITFSPDQAQPSIEITEDWYFLNTVKGRQAVALIRQGRLVEVQSIIPKEARLRVDRPNIFTLYEQNIGMLTPILADQLRDLERTYAPDWIDEAFTIAVSRNKRHLRYIQNILKRWETEGKTGDSYEESGRNSEEQRRKNYLPDEYSDIIIG